MMLIFIIAAGIVLGLFVYNHPGSFGRALLFIIAVIALTYGASHFSP
jgi:hypothetical protein